MSGPVKYSMDSTSNNETLTNHRDFHWDPLPQIFQSFFFFLEEGRWRRGRGCKTKMLLSLINSDIPEDTTPGDKTWQHPQINLSIFQSISVIQLLLSSVLPCGCKERSFSCNLSNIKHQTLQATRREWKSNAQQSVFGKLWDLWKCDATLSPMLDISSQVKIESPLQIIIFIVVKIGIESLNRNAVCQLTSSTESPNLLLYYTLFTDYLDSKFHPWLTRSRNEPRPKEDGRHLPVHDQPNHTTNKSNLFFYLACLF